MLALPALACGPFFGDAAEEVEVAVEEAAEDAAAAVEEAAEEIAGAVATSVATVEPTTVPEEAATSEEESAPADQESGAEPANEESADTSEDSAPELSDAASSSELSDDEAISTIAEAYRSGLAVDSVRIAMTNTVLDSDQTDTIIIEFIRPDRFHMVSNDLEIVIIEETTYIKGEDGVWLESPFGMNEMVEPFLDSFLDESTVDDIVTEMENDTGAYQYLGEESLNGTQTRVFEFVTPSLISDAPDRVTVWIGSEDGRIYRQEVESDAPEGRILVILEYAYDSDVVIEPPI